jgi:hypothetical protein
VRGQRSHLPGRQARARRRRGRPLLVPSGRLWQVSADGRMCLQSARWTASSRRLSSATCRRSSATLRRSSTSSVARPRSAEPSWKTRSSRSVSRRVGVGPGRHSRRCSAVGPSVFLGGRRPAAPAAGAGCMASATSKWSSFLNQPIEVAELRPRLAETIGRRRDYPQLLVRFGYGSSLRLERRSGWSLVARSKSDLAGGSELGRDVSIGCSSSR